MQLNHSVGYGSCEMIADDVETFRTAETSLNSVINHLGFFQKGS